jgi:hypothetical protein
VAPAGRRGSRPDGVHHRQYDPDPILLIADAQGDRLRIAVVILVLLGVLLAVLAVQFIFDGIGASGILA